MTPSEIDKQELRAVMKAQRALLPVTERALLSDQLATRLGKQTPPPGVVSGYLPIRDEIDPRPLMDRLQALGWQLALPVMQADRSLWFRAYARGDDLDVKAWGIREPKADKFVLTPSVMLVPLLAVDRAGNRLGYGAGHYDRAIAAIRAAGHPLTTIGLAFDVQIIDAVPHMPYDEPLDAILSPSGVTWCRVQPERLRGLWKD